MNRRQRAPWWFGFAFIGVAMVPLLAAGNKTKNRLWTGLGVFHLFWFMLRPADASIGLVSIGLSIYTVVVVRKQFLTEMEVQSALKSPQPVQHQQPTIHPNHLHELHAWSCTGCGAENHNAMAICEYCGVAMK
ncbi:MAG: hypothetical protein FWE07_09080 [Turicibacter sp.]|nr:hypothetical protein [Turicibacter sp.]